MTELSLKERLTKYLRNNHGFIASGDLQRLVAEKTTYTPRTTCRRLEELAVDGVLEVQYRKGHAYYRISEVKSPQQLSLESLHYFDNLGTQI